jgi:hypothetical protein
MCAATRPGAELSAACVIAGIKALANHPLTFFFSAKANGVEKAGK